MKTIFAYQLEDENIDIIGDAINLFDKSLNYTYKGWILGWKKEGDEYVIDIESFEEPHLITSHKIYKTDKIKIV